VDLKGFDPNAAPPITSAKQFTQAFSQNEADAHVKRFADEQRRAGVDGAWTLEQIKVGTDFPEKMFMIAMRTHFDYLGRAKVTDHSRVGGNQKCERGLWVLKRTAENIKAGRFVTVEEARMRYEKGLKKDVAPTSGLTND